MEEDRIVRGIERPSGMSSEYKLKRTKEEEECIYMKA